MNIGHNKSDGWRWSEWSSILLSQLVKSLASKCHEHSIGEGQAYFVTEPAHSGAYGLLVYHQTVYTKSHGQSTRHQTDAPSPAPGSRKKQKKQSKSETRRGRAWTLAQRE